MQAEASFRLLTFAIVLLPYPLKGHGYESDCAHGHSIGLKKRLDDGDDDAGPLGLVQSSGRGWAGWRCYE